MQKNNGLYKLLQPSKIYSMLIRLIASKRKRQSFVKNYIRPVENCKILEIDCGPAKILEYYPNNIEYVGIDINENYINNVRDTYGGDKKLFFAVP